MLGVVKLEPVPSNVPPDEALYQSIAVPAALDADNVTVPGPHRDPLMGFVGAAGLGFTVIVTVDVTAGHGPEGSFVVNVSVTAPPAILGVYVDVSEVGLENVPLDAVQVALVALPPIVPANVIVPPAQTACIGPAFTVAA
jgi:hypothetical protein